MKRAIRVLVVDDSMIFREVIARAIAADDQIEVVGTAGDPFEARDKLIALRPDVMTCDVEMPRMNGIEFIRRLLPQVQLPVVIVSSANQAVSEAMMAGAVEFVKKPDPQSTRSVETFIHALIAAIKAAAAAKVVPPPAQRRTVEPIETAAPTIPVGAATRQLIAIGASTGGTEAIHHVLKHLPASVPGIVVVQHIPPGFSRMFAERLNQMTAFEVKEAATNDEVRPGRVLIAPGDRHMRVKKVGGVYRVDCFEGEKVNGHCPSVDVLFESAAKTAGNDCVGVIMTGMGYDGAKGLLNMRRKGARTIGQNEQSSVVYGMPKVAFELGAVEKQASLEFIPQAILKML
ncbi:two-component system chemotaxis response regulator CheB [Paenibacillus phyllosphaerae]|uniref:Protein-glutamate methylesterase/protein-glutamine glutaminase n=1 Tax=Paenibacillus phyllosphaerae TaxID=274593 RepID=A0A7W5AWD3_9BACL|nr:two-component system chemotaxis response regulator CheB [Paenibacillus phyllosphaerae]